MADKEKITLYLDEDLVNDIRERSKAVFMQENKVSVYIEAMLGDQLNRPDLVPQWWRTGRNG